jgi:hypothetical protein
MLSITGSPYFRNATWYNRDRPLFRRYVPILREINHAGWHPLTGAVVIGGRPPAVSRVWVERFGPSEEGFVYFTIRNEGRPDLAQSLTLLINGSTIGLATGQHTVREMTRDKTRAVATTGSSSSLAINMDDSPTGLGAVAINETLVLKVQLSAPHSTYSDQSSKRSGAAASGNGPVV